MEMRCTCTLACVRARARARTERVCMSVGERDGGRKTGRGGEIHTEDEVGGALERDSKRIVACIAKPDTKTQSETDCAQ
jgi:hypothetical protein